MNGTVFEFKENERQIFKHRITKFLDNGDKISLVSNSLKDLIEEGEKRWNSFAIKGKSEEMDKLFKRLDNIKNSKPDIVCPYCGWVEQESGEYNNSEKYVCKKCFKTSKLNKEIVYRTSKCIKE